MTTTKRQSLTRGDKLYFAQFVLIGAVVTALILTYFGFPPISVALAAAALTTVSFVRGHAEKNMLSAVVSVPVLISAITLVIVS